jgi:uncharacterized membrane protein YhfC
MFAAISTAKTTIQQEVFGKGEQTFLVHVKILITTLAIVILQLHPVVLNIPAVLHPALLMADQQEA